MRASVHAAAFVLFNLKWCELAVRTAIRLEHASLAIMAIDASSLALVNTAALVVTIVFFLEWSYWISADRTAASSGRAF